MNREAAQSILLRNDLEVKQLAKFMWRVLRIDFVNVGKKIIIMVAFSNKQSESFVVGKI